MDIQNEATEPRYRLTTRPRLSRLTAAMIIHDLQNGESAVSVRLFNGHEAFISTTHECAELHTVLSTLADPRENFTVMCHDDSLVAVITRRTPPQE